MDVIPICDTTAARAYMSAASRRLYWTKYNELEVLD
jgi:hypothetical protein